LNNDIETANLQGTNLLTDKDSTISELTNQVNDLEDVCGMLTDKNKDITVDTNELTAELDKCRYDTENLKKELGTEINHLNHSINGNDINLKT
jgi:peptidoglycan hydrolase CwlO-like protein